MYEVAKREIENLERNNPGSSLLTWFRNYSVSLKIGESVCIYPYSSIGGLAEFIREYDEPKGVEIGNGVVIREGVTINAGTERDTYVGDECYLMAKSHVGHDARIANNTNLSTGSIIGGHSDIGKFCYIGLNAVVHQNSKIGDFCMIGAQAFFKGDSPAGLVWAGVPAKPIKINTVGLERHCENEAERARIIEEAKDFLTEYQNKEKNQKNWQATLSKILGDGLIDSTIRRLGESLIASTPQERVYGPGCYRPGGYYFDPNNDDGFEPPEDDEDNKSLIIPTVAGPGTDMPHR